MERNKMRMFETGKSKVVSFRVGENVYQELERMAELQGGTISTSARSLLLSSLDTENMNVSPGDILYCSEPSLVVVVVDSDTSAKALKAYIMDMSAGGKVINSFPMDRKKK